MTNAEARFSNSLRPRKPEGSLGRTAQDVHLDSHTAPELRKRSGKTIYIIVEKERQANKLVGSSNTKIRPPLSRFSALVGLF